MAHNEPEPAPEPVVEEENNAYRYLIPVWLRDTALGDMWTDFYIEFGDGQQALEGVRASSEYDLEFPGNKRDDGTLRYDENNYFSLMESYADSIHAIGLDPALFEEKFVDLLVGDVGADEFWGERIKPIYDRVMNNTDAVRAEYAAAFGIDLTDEAILASVLDPEGLGTRILEKTISQSELRGEFRARFDDIDTIEADYFTELYKYGVDQDSARSLFANAETIAPVLSVLASRHSDPDDEFDLQDFTQAAVFSDPLQVSRMRRLMAQERASFQKASSQVDIVRDRQTGASGLEER
jgi:hypothetical protein